MTTYREKGAHYEFLTKEGDWVEIDEGRIQFVPIPGDDVTNTTTNRAHLCYRQANDDDRAGPRADNVFGRIYLYCAFIPPGAI